MGNIPLDKAEILAIFLETFFFGIFFTLFCITIWVLLNKRSGPKTNRLLLSISVVMLLLATSHITIDFIRIIDAFIVYRDSLGPIAYYADVSRTLHVVKTAIYVVQTLTGDTLVIWRCYVIYRQNKFIIIFPVITLLADAVSGGAVTWSLWAAKPGSSIFTVAAGWITSYFVLTLCTNFYCTSAIVYRIWSSHRSVKAFGQGSLIPVIKAIVESAALYSSGLLAFLITYLSGSNGQYTALDLTMPLVGIVFSLIILQISLRSSSSQVHATSSISAIDNRSGFQRRVGTSGTGYPMQPISVEITHTTKTDASPSIPDVDDDAKSSSPEHAWNAV